MINNNWNRFTTFIIYDNVKPTQQHRQQPQLKILTTTATSKNITSIPTTASATAALYQSTKIELESLALNVINS